MPNGHTIPGDPFEIDKGPYGQLVGLWGGSCATTDQDYAIYRGTIGAFDSHQPLDCSTNGQTIWVFPPGEGDHYFLVVPRTPTSEGSYGVDSEGNERPAAPSGACREQVLGPCD
jgi:hypothetical protein